MAQEIAIHYNLNGDGSKKGQADFWLNYDVTTTDTKVTLRLNYFYSGVSAVSGYSVYTTIGDADVHPKSYCTVTLDGSQIASTGWARTGTKKTFSYTKSWDRGTDNSYHYLVLNAHIDAYIGNSAKTYYWHWENYSTSYQEVITVPVLQSWTVSYDANGGAGVSANQTKYYGKTLTLSSTTPVRGDYVFRRWNTNTSDSGTAYSPGGSYTGNAALKLYAIWNPKIYYSANGGSGAPTAGTKTYGVNYTISSTKPTRTDYDFWHWNTNTGDTGTTYNSGATYSGNTYLYLYAIWNARVYFNANGGSGQPATQVKQYKRNLTLSSTKPTRPKYKFWHWNTSKNNASTTYNPGATYTTDSPMTLFAIWNPIISYDANGGSGAPSAQDKTYGTALTLQSGIPTRSGYVFTSWNTAANGSGTSYAAGATYTSNEAVTLYAQWLKGADAPTISSMTVVRCNSSGTLDDFGEYCKVTATWRVDTTNVSGNTGTVTGTIKPDGGTARSFTFSSGASGTSGTATAIVSDISTDIQYDVTVKVTDKNTFTTRTDVCTRAKFIMDFRNGGEAMGIGSAAPQTGLEVGWLAQFDRDVTMLEDLSVSGNVGVTGNLTAPQLAVTSVNSDVATASGNWSLSSQMAYVTNRTCMVVLGLYSTAGVTCTTTKSITVSGTTYNISVKQPVSCGTIATLKTGYRPVNVIGFSNMYGIGQITSSGSVSFKAFDDITASSTLIYVAVTFIKA